MDEGYRLGGGHVEHGGLLHPGGSHVRLAAQVEGFTQRVGHARLVEAFRDDKPGVNPFTLLFYVMFSNIICNRQNTQRCCNISFSNQEPDGNIIVLTIKILIHRHASPPSVAL